MMQSFLFQVDRGPELLGPEILKLVSVLDVIYWVKSSWSDLEASTMQNCFKHCVFEHKETLKPEQDVTVYDEFDDIPLSVLKPTTDVLRCDFKD
jgi:hypothetical protein